MTRTVFKLGLAVLVVITGVMYTGAALAEEPPQGQFDPAKLRAAAEACRCSSSLMDLHSSWNRENYEKGFGWYNEVYQQGQATELPREVYWGAPLLLASRQDRNAYNEAFGRSPGKQVIASSSGSLMEMMTRQNAEQQARRLEALRVKEQLIWAGEGGLMDMMSARD